MIKLIEHQAIEKHDGHLTIMRFTSGWKACLGTVDTSDRERLWEMPFFDTAEDAMQWAVDNQDWVYVHDEP